MDRKEVYISKEDFERIMAQGRKEDIERLFEFEMIKFKEKKIYSSQIKVLKSSLSSMIFKLKVICQTQLRTMYYYSFMLICLR